MDSIAPINWPLMGNVEFTLRSLGFDCRLWHFSKFEHSLRSSHLKLGYVRLLWPYYCIND